MMPLPHLVTLRRRFSSNRETQRAGVETDVETHIKALISPAGATLEGTMGGPAEVWRDMIFLEPGIEIKGGDILVDEGTDERWQVVTAPKTLQNPITWEDDHIEVIVSRDDLT